MLSSPHGLRRAAAAGVSQDRPLAWSEVGGWLTGAGLVGTDPVGVGPVGVVDSAVVGSAVVGSAQFGLGRRRGGVGLGSAQVGRVTWTMPSVMVTV